jgi:hypothetical protein
MDIYLFRNIKFICAQLGHTARQIFADTRYLCFKKVEKAPLLSDKDMKKISIAQNNWYYIPLSSLCLHIELSEDKGIATLVLGNTPIYAFTVRDEEDDLRLYSLPPSLGGIRTIYRNLRENYEYSL